jgi:hypothetical protein
LFPAVKRIALILIAFSGIAFAARGDDRARAEGAISRLKLDPAHARLAHEPMTQAERALRRADEARAASDTKHPPQLESLAREWAEAGVDLVRAAEAEKKLNDVQKQIADVETKTTRARALLEESIARRGRAQAKLDELEPKKPSPAPEPTKPAPATKPPPPPVVPAPVVPPPAPGGKKP